MLRRTVIRLHGLEMCCLKRLNVECEAESGGIEPNPWNGSLRQLIKLGRLPRRGPPSGIFIDTPGAFWFTLKA